MRRLLGDEQVLAKNVESDAAERWMKEERTIPAA